MTADTQRLDAVPSEYRQMIASAITRLADEFQGIFGRETVERFVFDSLDDLKGAKVKNFIPLFAERFARDRLWSLAKVEGRITAAQPMVLFLCVQNAGRSQMASGWTHHLAGDRVRIMSGGSTPDEEINPNAVAAMSEVGIDISRQFPKPWTDEVVQAADVVITMGCGDACPIYPGKRYEDWEVTDPAGADLEAVRIIRDDIKARVVALLASLDIEVNA
jgi:protein-tyrosine-phosphatase